MANSLGNQVAPRGRSSAGKPGEVRVGRWTVFLHALFRAWLYARFHGAGFCRRFAGRSLNVYMPVIQKLGAILFVIFCPYHARPFPLVCQPDHGAGRCQPEPGRRGAGFGAQLPESDAVHREARTDMHEVNRGWGYLSSSLMGISFAAGWVPCVGPILASILFLAGDSQTAWQGAGLCSSTAWGWASHFCSPGWHSTA